MTDKDFDKTKTPAEVIDDHRDPITGAPHSHPTATGVGAATAGILATAAGALAAGPLGAIAGAIVGSGAGGLVGHTVGENNEQKELQEAGAAAGIHSRVAEEDRIRNATDTTHLEPGIATRTGDPINGPLAAPLSSAARDVPNSGDFRDPQASATDTLGAAGARTSVDPTRQYNDPSLTDTFSDPKTRDANLLDDDSDDIVGVVIVEETTIITTPTDREFDKDFGDDFSDRNPRDRNQPQPDRFDPTQPSGADAGLKRDRDL